MAYVTVITLLLTLILVAHSVEQTCKSESAIQCKFVCSGRRNTNRCMCGSDGKTYQNTCEMRCTSARSGLNINYDHAGPCEEECDAEDFEAFKYRFVEWFDMIEKDQLPNEYLRSNNLDVIEILQLMFHKLDTSEDVILEWGELASVAENNYEHCVSEFYRLCDTDDNLQLTLKEWGNCFDKHIKMKPCDRARIRATKARLQGTSNYYPTCTEEGYCLPKQCDESFCWCVSPSCRRNKSSFGRRTPNFTCENY